MGLASRAQGARRRRCGDIVDDEQRRDRPATPMRPKGSGGAWASALLALLDNVPALPASRRLASAHAALGTRHILTRISQPVFYCGGESGHVLRCALSGSSTYCRVCLRGPRSRWLERARCALYPCPSAPPRYETLCEMRANTIIAPRSVIYCHIFRFLPKIVSLTRES